MRTLLAFFLIFSFAACADSDVQTNGGIQTKEIEYSSAGTTLKGYLAWGDSVKGKRPGVLVVHEWWGHNQHARDRARMLAELGYTALAVDMYGARPRASRTGAVRSAHSSRITGSSRFLAWRSTSLNFSIESMCSSSQPRLTCETAWR